MKQIITILSSFLFTTATEAQVANWDSTYRPNNFEIKIEQFKSYPNASTDMIFLGNSITAGTDWMELLGRPTARNRGISGDISFGVLQRLDEITEGKPAKIFVLIGINDISRNIPDSMIVSNFEKIIHRIKWASSTTKIYFQTLLPVNNEFTQFKNHYNKDQHILFVNAEMKKLAERERITLIDLYPHFLDSNNRLEKKFTLDGLHLTPAGYKKWASILEQGKYLE